MRFPSLLYSVLVLVLWLAPVPEAHAERKKKEEKVPLPKPPPQPVPATLRVLRKGQVEVPLKIYGQQHETVRYIIRSTPEAGVLSDPQTVGQQNAKVLYTPPAKGFEVKKVRFLYAAQTSAGVSAPAEVVIDIVDEPAQLITPAELFFPKILAGTVGKLEFEVANQGGLIAEGLLEVDRPYRIEGEAAYRLEPGERRMVTLAFAPQAGGSFRRELRFSSQPERVISLQGQADAAVALSAPELTLTQTAGNPRRSGVVELMNHTLEERKLEIKAVTRLELPESVVVPAEGKVNLPVIAKPEQPSALREEVVLSGAGLELRLVVQAPGIAPTLHPLSSVVLLPKGATGRGGQVELAVENLGVTAGFWRAEAPAPFSVTPAEVRLDPGARGTLQIAWAEAPPVLYRALVKFTGEQHTLEVPVEGTLLPVITAAAAPVSRRVPAPEQAVTAPTSATPAARGRSSGGSLFDNIPEGLRHGPLVRWVSKTTTTATLGWPTQAAEGQRLEVQLRHLALTQGKLEVRWEPHRPMNVTQEGAETRATMQNLKPGVPYFVRVAILSPKGGAARGIFEGQVVTVEQSWVGWVLIGLAVLGAGTAGGWAWHKRRLKAGQVYTPAPWQSSDNLPPTRLPLRATWSPCPIRQVIARQRRSQSARQR